ncbi:hypothetical protein A3A84_02950 [Candidatus Collierbacteria bacterium RIFCSPLOWO2_01_FULL_50_23]|nr:MAG: hypothetical protein A3A84_02950 [Candidatus Collierbacteria bacterium RIFCSPLOWO2_01_FULL_50_23]
MTLPQIVSLFSIAVLTTVAAVIGIQIVFLLKEVAHTLKKFNGALDATETAMKRFAEPVANMLAVVEGLKHSTKIIEIFSSYINKHGEPKPPITMQTPL